MRLFIFSGVKATYSWQKASRFHKLLLCLVWTAVWEILKKATWYWGQETVTAALEPSLCSAGPFVFWIVVMTKYASNTTSMLANANSLILSFLFAVNLCWSSLVSTKSLIFHFFIRIWTLLFDLFKWYFPKLLISYIYNFSHYIKLNPLFLWVLWQFLSYGSVPSSQYVNLSLGPFRQIKGQLSNNGLIWPLSLTKYKVLCQLSFFSATGISTVVRTLYSTGKCVQNKSIWWIFSTSEFVLILLLFLIY